MAKNNGIGNQRQQVLMLFGRAPEYGEQLSMLSSLLAPTDFHVSYRNFQQRYDFDLESVINESELSSRARPRILKAGNKVTDDFISGIPFGSQYSSIRKIATYFNKNDINLTDEKAVSSALENYSDDYKKKTSYYQMLNMMRFDSMIAEAEKNGERIMIIPFLSANNATLYDYIKKKTAKNSSGHVEFTDISEEGALQRIYDMVNENIISRLSTQEQKIAFDPDYQLSVPYEYNTHTYHSLREGLDNELAIAIKESRKLGAKALSEQEKINMVFSITESALGAQKALRTTDGKILYPIDYFRDTLVLDNIPQRDRLIKGLTIPVLKGGTSMWKAYRNYMNDNLKSNPLYRYRDDFSLTKVFDDSIMSKNGTLFNEILLGEYLLRGIKDGDSGSERTLRIEANIIALFKKHPELEATFKKISSDEIKALFDLSGNPIQLPDKNSPLYGRCAIVKDKAEKNRIPLKDAWSRTRFFSRFPEFNPLGELAEPVVYSCRDEQGQLHNFKAKSLYACMAISLLKKEGTEGRSQEELFRASEIASGAVAEKNWLANPQTEGEKRFEKAIRLLSTKNAAWRKNVSICRQELPEMGEKYLNGIYSGIFDCMKDVKMPVDTICSVAHETEHEEELKIVGEMEKLKNTGLTENQMKCVSSIINAENGNRNTLLLAGPGSGKTRVLVRTVYELMKKGVRPENIVMFTFTNAAADEFASRLRLLMDSDPRLKGKRMPSVSTAHSYALKILRDNHEQAGLPETFRTAETQTILSCLGQSFREILKPALRKKEDSYTETSRRIIEFISKIKAQGICGIPVLDENLEKNPDFIKQLEEAPIFNAWRDTGAKINVFRQCYETYQNTLRENALIDLSDIMIKSVSLLMKNREVRESINRNLSYLLVDEIQDANVLLLQLMSAVSGEKTNIVGAGDVNQNIYRYMNSGKYSDGRSIVQYLCDDPSNGFTKLFLTENLRSTAEIVRFANEVRKMTETAEAEYESEAGLRDGELIHGEKPAVYVSADEQARWDWSLRKAEEGMNKEGETTMILCRTNRELKEIRDYARKHYPGIRFANRSNDNFTDAHYDVIAVMGYLSNPSSPASYALLMNRLIAQSPFMIPEPDISSVKTIDELKKVYESSSPDASKFTQAIEKGIRNVMAIDGDRHGSIKAFEAMGIFMATLTDGEGKPLREKGNENVNYHAVCGEYYMSESPALISDIELKREEQRYGNEEISSSFVYLMTIHGSKGLEADNVILPNITPSRNFATSDVDSSNEDLKVLYTGVTRGRKTVSICAENEKFIRNLDQNSFTLESSSQKVIEIKNNSELFANISDDDDDDWVQTPESDKKESLGPLNLKDLMASPEEKDSKSQDGGLSKMFSPKAIKNVRGKVIS